jgi:hypothetical protein
MDRNGKGVLQNSSVINRYIGTNFYGLDEQEIDDAENDYKKEYSKTGDLTVSEKETAYETAFYKKLSNNLEIFNKDHSKRFADALLTNVLIAFCTGVSIWTIVDKFTTKPM